MAALAYARCGRAIFPVRGKLPLTKHGCLDATTDRHLIALWPWDRATGVGLATGAASQCWVVDIDGERGEASLAALVAQHGPLVETATSHTGGGGRHLVWRWPADRDVRCSASRIGPGLDVRGTGGYVVVPPSRHPSGRRYQWISCVRRFADAPAWLLGIVAPVRPTGPARAPIPPAERIPALRNRVDRWVHHGAWREIEAVEMATEGGRNARLNAAAHALGRYVGGGLLDRAEVVARLTAAAETCGLGARETAKTIASGLAAGKQNPRDRAWVESYLAERGRAA
ncbi:MAG: bifunctional DNA primase/polymerase [Deltaproteobacteria bacterium]|nr:bifunctional DNA primase/polymerase [Deltaproteobacteria bacterium]